MHLTSPYFCRVENEPNAPSRQDVLTKSGRMRHTPDRLSARSVRPNGSSNKSFGNRSTNRNLDTKKDESKGVQNLETKKTNAKDVSESNDKKLSGNVHENADKDRMKGQANQTNNTTKDQKRPFEYVSDSKKNAPYLSKKNLEKHNRMVHDAWRNKEKDNVHEKISKDLKKHNELTPLDKDLLLKKAKASLADRKAEHNNKQQRKKHRIVQRSTDYIFLKSKADSYKTIYEKKQKYAELTHRDEQLNLRKTQSSDDIWKKKIADEVFQTFKEEREKLSKQKQLTAEDSAFNTNSNMENTDVNDKKKYFTRNTTERYKSKPQTDDVNDRFERFNRINVNEVNHGDSEHNRGNKTSRSEHHRIRQKSNNRRRERYLNDIEREDQYMMDMDFLAKEYEEKLNEKKFESTAEGVHSNSEGEKLNDQQYRNNHDVNSETNYPLSSTPNSHAKLRHQRTPRSQHEEANNPEQTSNIRNTRQNFNNEGKEKTKNNGDDFPTSGGYDDTPKDATSKQNPDKENIYVDTVDDNLQKDKDRLKSLQSTPRKKTRKVSNVSFVSSYKQKNKKSVGRAHFIQSYNSTPRPVTEMSNMTKTIEWKNNRKVDKELLERFNEQQRAKRAPRAEEVTIRDKLKLQINVVDRKIDDSEQIEREKRKIKRFWQAVDGDELRDEKEMFGDIDENDKMLVAKVTKERKMSSKSKNSKHSKGSVVTHSVGNFNVTLEVAN